MNESQWIKQLEEEGYQGVQVFSKDAGTEWPSHTHEKTTVHVILSGELSEGDENGSRVHRADDRFEIFAGSAHWAKCGDAGCTFIVGWR